MNSKTIRKQVIDAMIPLLKSRNQFIQTEAGRQLLALVPDVFVTSGVTNEAGADRKSNAELLAARQTVLAKIQRRQEARKAQNKRAHARRKLRVKLKAQGWTEEAIEAHIAKLTKDELHGASTAQQSALQASNVLPAINTLYSDDPRLVDFTLYPVSETEDSKEYVEWRERYSKGWGARDMHEYIRERRMLLAPKRPKPVNITPAVPVPVVDPENVLLENMMAALETKKEPKILENITQEPEEVNVQETEQEPEIDFEAEMAKIQEQIAAVRGNYSPSVLRKSDRL